MSTSPPVTSAPTPRTAGSAAVAERGTSLEITVRTGTGTGRTSLAAFDAALMEAGVANLNLIHLSSVIPPGSRVTRTSPALDAGHGDRLYCVLSTAYAEHPGEIVWAGLGWVLDEEAGGLFVEHTAGSEESLREQIAFTLGDMTASRGGDWGEVQMAMTSAHCIDRAVCALTVAAYDAIPWTLDV